MLLEVEAKLGMTTCPDSLMDRVMVGIITTCGKSYLLQLHTNELKSAAESNPTSLHEPSDYLNTLLRDPTSSHLFEIVVAEAPHSAFSILWSTYFKGKLIRLAAHPVANFVVSKALERATPDQLIEACEELDVGWGKIISTYIFLKMLYDFTFYSQNRPGLASCVP